MINKDFDDFLHYFLIKTTFPMRSKLFFTLIGAMVLILSIGYGRSGPLPDDGLSKEKIEYPSVIDLSDFTIASPALPLPSGLSFRPAWVDSRYILDSRYSSVCLLKPPLLSESGYYYSLSNTGNSTNTNFNPWRLPRGALSTCSQPIG